jgi:hypothetical protein
MQELLRRALEYHRNGDDDAAVAAIGEITEPLLPSVTELYRNEIEPDLRAFLVRIAWERREPGSVEFILEALNDPDEEVWQSALDGTVALASPEMLDMLQTAKSQERADAATTRRFQICIDEAILYVEGLTQAGQRR